MIWSNGRGGGGGGGGGLLREDDGVSADELGRLLDLSLGFERGGFNVINGILIDSFNCLLLTSLLLCHHAMVAACLAQYQYVGCLAGVAAQQIFI